MIVNSSEIEWLNEHYPGLGIEVFNKSALVIRGVFKFKAAFNNSDKGYIVNPPDGMKYSHPVIADSYNIEISADLSLENFPIIKNIDSRILDKARKLGKDTRDFHVYSEPGRKNVLCVAGPLDVDNIKGNISLRDLLNQVLLPFFYDNSHYEQYGSRPRKDYSHAVWGVLENYYDLKSDCIEMDKICINKLKLYRNKWPQIKKIILRRSVPKGHHNCVVCRGVKIHKCHIEIFRALFKLHQRVRAQGLEKELSDPLIKSIANFVSQVIPRESF